MHVLYPVFGVIQWRSFLLLGSIDDKTFEFFRGLFSTKGGEEVLENPLKNSRFVWKSFFFKSIFSAIPKWQTVAAIDRVSLATKTAVYIYRKQIIHALRVSAREILQTWRHEGFQNFLILWHTFHWWNQTTKFFHLTLSCSGVIAILKLYKMQTRNLKTRI